jgi:hypothetical protein
LKLARIRTVLTLAESPPVRGRGSKHALTCRSRSRTAGPNTPGELAEIDCDSCPFCRRRFTARHRHPLALAPSPATRRTQRHRRNRGPRSRTNLLSLQPRPPESHPRRIDSFKGTPLDNIHGNMRLLAREKSASNLIKWKTFSPSGAESYVMISPNSVIGAFKFLQTCGILYIGEVVVLLDPASVISIQP